MRQGVLIPLMLLLPAVPSECTAQQVVPIPFAHAHNDYWHGRPLLDALEQGFASVEADVILDEGQLLVGHDTSELRPERTLQALYLDPLRRRVREHDGKVYATPCPFYLLIDIKSGGVETYEALAQVLVGYAEMLTVTGGGHVKPGAVTVILSGDTPRARVLQDATRYAGLDGRLSDLESTLPAAAMPMISDRWTAHFRWAGAGPMPADERAKLRDVVAQAHAAGRVVRFWSTPESEEVWHELRQAGVDLINTDQLARLAQFSRTAESPSP